jgi:micrococcal nuclease
MFLLFLPQKEPMRSFIFALFMAIAAGSVMGQEAAHRPLYKIKKFVDGDTFWVENGSEKGMKVRLIGVDAPEPRKVFNTPAEPYGKAASAHLAAMLSDSLVGLGFDVDSLDRFGRTLAYAWLPDGGFVNAKMVEDGYAAMATFPPNVKYTALFQALQAKAQEENKGLWVEGDVE